MHDHLYLFCIYYVIYIMYIAYVCMYIHIVLCHHTVQVAKHTNMFVHISTYVNGPVGIKNIFATYSVLRLSCIL